MTESASPAGADHRNRQARGDRRRQQILDAAVDLFGANGYRGTGVAELAERVGMTATGLLYYFGTKERLLQEVVAERGRGHSLSIIPDLRLADLRGLGHHNTEEGALTRLHVVLAIENLDVGEPLHDFFVDRYALTRSFFAALVEAEKELGTVWSDVDAEQIAREILATVLGFETQWLMDPDAVDYGSAMEAYIDRLVADLAEGTT